jgi:hypothetical protein
MQVIKGKVSSISSGSGMALTDEKSPMSATADFPSAFNQFHLIATSTYGASDEWKDTWSTNCFREDTKLSNCNSCSVVDEKRYQPKNVGACSTKSVAKLNDEQLFKQPPPEDCPICYLRLPSMKSGRKYKSCCGKIVCSGCSSAPVYDSKGKIIKERKCPFCRSPAVTSEEEMVQRHMKRAKLGDAEAIYIIGCYYANGSHGFPRDRSKVLEIWKKAGELGHAEALLKIGIAYHLGRGVGKSRTKERQYMELAAIRGDTTARHHLGYIEECVNNLDVALKHYLIAARSGSSTSINELFMAGNATTDDVKKTFHAYQTYINEIKSSQRDRAAVASERFKYY